MSRPSLDMTAAIEACVEDFLARAYGDPVLAPLFIREVSNLPDHVRRVRDFWRDALMSGDDRPGAMRRAHMALDLEPVHFERWGAHFREAVLSNLPPTYAGAVLARAEFILSDLKERPPPVLEAPAPGKDGAEIIRFIRPMAELDAAGFGRARASRRSAHGELERD